MEREVFLKNKIFEKGYKLKEFAAEIKMPYTTLLSIVNNSVGGASLDNIRKICNGLDIDIECLAPKDKIGDKKNDDIELFNKLDDNDKAEIRGEMRQMLKADKYKNKENNIIQITEQPRKEFDFSTVRIAGDDGEFKEMHYTPEEQEEIRKAIEKDPKLKEFFGI